MQRSITVVPVDLEGKHFILAKGDYCYTRHDLDLTIAESWEVLIKVWRSQATRLIDDLGESRRGAR